MNKVFLGGTCNTEQYSQLRDSGKLILDSRYNEKFEKLINKRRLLS